MDDVRLRSLSILNIDREYILECVSKNINGVIDIFGKTEKRQQYLRSQSSKWPKCFGIELNVKVCNLYGTLWCAPNPLDTGPKAGVPPPQ